MVWQILCFGDGFPFPSLTMAGNEANRDRTDGAMEQRAAANLERSVPAAVDGLERGFRVFESNTWRPTGSTSSPWADKKSKPRMGLYTAASKKVTKKVRSPNDRRWRTVPQHGMALPSAPESCGPVGGVFEQCGRTLQTAPVSTMNCCLLSSSCKKIMPPPRVFSSRRPTRGPLAPGLALHRTVAIGMVVVANVAVLLIRTGGLLAAVPLAGRRAAGSVVGGVLPAAAAGNCVDGCFIVRIDGGDVLPLLLAYSLSAYSAILLQSLKS
jgi:hypothetical protein